MIEIFSLTFIVKVVAIEFVAVFTVIFDVPSLFPVISPLLLMLATSGAVLSHTNETVLSCLSALLK
ncbi:hypothetical protein OAJ14_00110 [Polaribacter sp.]|nr:hypothetical protein [Polaribacter sp.]